MSQKTVFKEIAVENSTCYVCEGWPKDPFGNPTTDHYPYMFAHVVAKGFCPRHKLTKANVKFVCSVKCHHIIDKATKGLKEQLIERLDEGKEIDSLLKPNIYLLLKEQNEL